MSTKQSKSASTKQSNKQSKSAQSSSASPVRTHNLQEILAQLEGPAGMSEMLKKAADAKTYYGENDLAIDVLRNKYLAPGETGPLHLWDRIARAMASVEKDQEYWYNRFFSLLMDFKFIPGGRVMHGAGRDDARRKPTLSNCYVVPIEEDSIEGIYRCLSESAMVFRTGGGVGTDLSILRPQGASVNATVDASPGCTAFMNLLSESTNAVSQAGRRGALMLTLRVDHPDIESFITIKNDANRTKVQYANISVLVTHEFMEAVLSDSDFDLRFDGEVYRTIKARELWNKIIANAHSSAEPGIIFWDTMKEYHNVEYANPLTSTNPCGEQPLASYTACNLGNINLTKFIDEDGNIDQEELAETTRVATRFLDDVIEYNMPSHALEKIRDAVSSDRRVGLGITGLADALLLMKKKYDSEEALEAIDTIMRTICHTAYETSVELAKEKGAFPIFDWDGMAQSKFIQELPADLQDKTRQHGLRNCTLITMPPVGTGSIVAETSSGIEPIFCTSYNRRVKQEDGESFRDYKVYHPVVKQLFGGDEDLPDYVVTSHHIDPFFRVKMQGVIQKYTDSSISSTINLPEDTDVETVADIYITAYKEGLKGVTVYREGSREGILQTEDQSDKKEEEAAKAEADPLGSAFHPRQRPAVTQGVTERINTGEGKIYITINEDEQGVCEVFSTIGKAGGNAAAQSEAISRLISLSLRSGVDPTELIKELKGISGPTPVWDNGELVLSTPDAIGKALERHLERRESDNFVHVVAHTDTGVIKAGNGHHSNGNGNGNGNGGVKTMATCPECGSTVAHESGCMTCRHCGWSKC
jgi:ribonucleoside-diphosphate reductase alpha chain